MGPENHPAMLGRPAREAWGEVWSVAGLQVDSIMAGGAAIWHENQLIPVTRHGAREDVWWNYGYSPIRDQGRVRGVLVICSDVSAEYRAKVALEALNRRFMEENARRAESEQNHKLLLQIADTLRGLTDADAIAPAAVHLVSGYLPVSQIDYAEVDSSGALFLIRHSWAMDGLPSLAGMGGHIDAYGLAVSAALRSAQVVTIANVANEPRTAAHAAPWPGLHARACMIVPVMKNSALVAILTLHQDLPCHWSPSHIPLVRDIADLIWNAMAHGRRAGAPAPSRKRAGAPAQRRERAHAFPVSAGARLHGHFQRPPSRV